MGTVRKYLNASKLVFPSWMCFVLDFLKTYISIFASFHDLGIGSPVMHLEHRVAKSFILVSHHAFNVYLIFPASFQLFIVLSTASLCHVSPFCQKVLSSKVIEHYSMVKYQLKY